MQAHEESPAEGIMLAGAVGISAGTVDISPGAADDISLGFASCMIGVGALLSTGTRDALCAKTFPANSEQANKTA